MEPKYPNIELELVGQDGNAFSVLGAAQNAMKKGGLSGEERQEFLSEAMEGDYDHLLQTCMRWFEVY